MDARIQQINLYNPALRRQRVWLSLGNLAALSGVFALFLLALGFVLHSQAGANRQRVQQLETRLATARAETMRLSTQLGASPERDAAARELAELKRQLALRREVLVALQGGAAIDGGRSSAGFSDYLRGLARQTVNGLWLTGFAVAQGGDGMEVRGRMLVVDRLPEYIRRLNGEASFKGRQFVSLDISRSGRPGEAGPGTPHSAFVLKAMPVPANEAPKKEPVR